jgi:hypothetical protein
MYDKEIKNRTLLFHRFKLAWNILRADYIATAYLRNGQVNGNQLGEATVQDTVRMMIAVQELADHSRTVLKTFGIDDEDLERLKKRLSKETYSQITEDRMQRKKR